MNNLATSQAVTEPIPLAEEAPAPQPATLASVKYDKLPMITSTGLLVPPDPTLPWPRKVLYALLRGLNGVFSYIVINFTSALAFFVYRVLNRVRVYGRSRVGTDKNTLILANHRTMIDSYLIGHLTSWPWSWIKPHMLPLHPAAKENFFRNRWIGWLSARWKCIPVKRGVRDSSALSAMVTALPHGQMVIFPEGTRSRTGELGQGRPGTGKLIRDTQCKAVPCYVKGMENVLPIGASFPRFFKRVEVIFGDPIPLDDLMRQEDSVETSKAIIDRVMERVGALKVELEELEAERARRRQALLRTAQRVILFPATMIRRLVSF